jgi:hypothetical protein
MADATSAQHAVLQQEIIAICTVPQQKVLPIITITRKRSAEECIGDSESNKIHKIERKDAFNSGKWIQRDTLAVKKSWRWYYADELMNAFPHDGDIPENSATHIKFMDQYDLWCEAMPEWLQEAGRCILRSLDAEEQVALVKYMKNSFKNIWRYYENGKQIVEDDESPLSRLEPKLFAAFDRIWSGDACLASPVGMVLFEGQGLNEYDAFNAKVGDHLVRRRPTSTSWSLNAALHFAGYKLDGVLFVHHIQDRALKMVLAQELANRGYGCAWIECEVLLQPGITITIEKETFESIERYSMNRSSIVDCRSTKLRVLHTCVRAHRAT